MRAETVDQVMREMKFFIAYFEHFVEQDPLYWPELERAQKILDMVTAGGARPGLAERVRNCLSAPMAEHHDGSGWHGFKSAVAVWLELTEQSSAVAVAHR